MSKRQRLEHDDAWGLDFGDPHDVEIFCKDKSKKSILSRFKKDGRDSDDEMLNLEHPMCINGADSLRQQLEESVDLLEYRDDSGNSMLHSEALAGNSLIVKILLDFGADPNLKNKNGQTPQNLARLMKWDNVVRELAQK